MPRLGEALRRAVHREREHGRIASEDGRRPVALRHARATSRQLCTRALATSLLALGMSRMSAVGWWLDCHIVLIYPVPDSIWDRRAYLVDIEVHEQHPPHAGIALSGARSDR